MATNKRRKATITTTDEKGDVTNDLSRAESERMIAEIEAKGEVVFAVYEYKGALSVWIGSDPNMEMVRTIRQVLLGFEKATLAAIRKSGH